jgi:hypothetical protein
MARRMKALKAKEVFIQASRARPNDTSGKEAQHRPDIQGQEGQTQQQCQDRRNLIATPATFSI